MHSRSNEGGLFRIQRNVVIFVNTFGALSSKSLVGNSYVLHNQLGEKGANQPSGVTRCARGDVINWIVYPIDMNKRLSGAWPPMPKIDNIVFLDDEGTVAAEPPCSDLRVYGGADKIRSEYTRVYYYWAGRIPKHQGLSSYPYRLIVSVQDVATGEPQHFNLEGLSLDVCERRQ